MTFALPQTYSRIPIAPPPGSLEATLAPMQAGYLENLTAVATSINQIIQALSALDATDISLTARVKIIEAAVTALRAEDANLLSRTQNFVKLTAGGSPTTWALASQTGYPYLRAVVIDPNGQANTLNLPALGANDRLCITVKCLSNSGTVEIDSGAANIVTLAGPGSGSLIIPYAFVADGLNISTYAATLLWTGTEWNVIDTAILTA